MAQLWDTLLNRGDGPIIQFSDVYSDLIDPRFCNHTPCTSKPAETLSTSSPQM